MKSFCSGSLEIKCLHSKENYWTVESGNAEVMISHVSGGPERAVISGPTAPLIPTSTKTAATIRAELYHLCCWEVSPPAPVPHPQVLFPNLPQPEPWGQAHFQVLPPIVGLQSLASAWDSRLALHSGLLSGQHNGPFPPLPVWHTWRWYVPPSCAAPCMPSCPIATTTCC